MIAVERLRTALAERYRIERELGAGGMATVYLAHDLRHERRVALKVLRPELAAVIGADRFLKEIKVTANLQHPHILGLIDSGEVDGVLYYVMHFSDGESLRDRLTREKQLTVEDAVRIAREVASALDYAHRHHVIHRDIKPENILLHDNQALVADFGIALAVSSASDTRITETGMSLGTPHYMSPEQAMGERDITARSDVYALGCVLYEMLAGEPPFTGPTAQAILARVMIDQPRSLTSQRRTVPAAVDAAVRKALEKLPVDRFATAAQFADALRVTETHEVAVRRTPPPAPAQLTGLTGRARRLAGSRVLPWALFVTTLGVLAGLMSRRSPTAEPATFQIVLPESLSIRSDHNNTSIALSPDGRLLAYTGHGGGGRRQLLVRDFRQLLPRVLPGTEGAEGPFFSPDGAWVAFYANGKLKKSALAGGPPIVICDAQSARGGDWGPADTIVFAPSASSLLLVSASGGTPRRLTKVLVDSGETSHRFPKFLPDGKAILFVRQGGAGAVNRVAVASVATGAVTTLIDDGTAPHYVSGHLVYLTMNGALNVAAFDARRRAVSMAPISLFDGISVKRPSGAGEFSVSRNGTLVFLGGVAQGALTLVDRRGRQRVLAELTGPASPRFSPDGQRIALTSFQPGTVDLSVFDTRRGTLSRLTFNGQARYPEWTPDGRRIGYSWIVPDHDPDLFWTAADGSGEPEVLLRRPQVQWEIAWTPDARAFVFRETSPETSRDLYWVRLDSARTVQPYLVSQFDERSPAISPDGRWLAYSSNESGHDEVYVRGFPNPAGRWQISVAGGGAPRWSRNGRELIYRNEDAVISVDVALAPTFSVGSHHTLFEAPFYGQADHAEYDVSADGSQFVFIGGSSARPDLIVTLNFFEELRRRSSARP